MNLRGVIGTVVLMLFFIIPGVTQPENPAEDIADVPISGIELLIGAGAIFGMRRYLIGRRDKA